MILTLQKLKVARSLSEETLAYTADVYLDGKLVGHGKNTGNGGCASFYVHTPEDKATVAAFEKELVALPPKLYDLGSGREIDIQGRNMADAIDQLAGEMDTDRELRSRMKRLMKKNTLFLTSEGKVRTGPLLGSAMEMAIAEQYPGATIINGLPFEEAVALCAKHM